MPGIYLENLVFNECYKLKFWRDFNLVTALHCTCTVQYTVLCLYTVLYSIQYTPPLSAPGRGQDPAAAAGRGQEGQVQRAPAPRSDLAQVREATREDKQGDFGVVLKGGRGGGIGRAV